MLFVSRKAEPRVDWLNELKLAHTDSGATKTQDLTIARLLNICMPFCHLLIFFLQN